MDSLSKLEKADQSIEIIDDQSRLSDLWNALNGLRKIKISAPIDISTTSMISPKDAKMSSVGGVESEVRVSGLEEGKLIVLKRTSGIDKQWTDIHLLQLKRDSRFMTETPLTNSAIALGWTGNEVVVYPDDEKFRTVRIQKTPVGFKIDFSSHRHDPAYTKDGGESAIICGLDGTDFLTLDNSTAKRAFNLAKEFEK